MSGSNVNSTVGNWVAAHPQTSRVFESLQIDYCCGGNKSLTQACRDRGLDPRQVVEQLEQAVADDSKENENWLNTSLTELCDHIERTHHVYLREELPRLTEMVAKVAKVHGEKHSKLVEIQKVFAALRTELEPHMFKEEQVLFPAIRQLEHASKPPSFPFVTVANPIRMMEHEHDNAGSALSQLRELTADYKIPHVACNTYRAMLAGLSELEKDMHQHVHKENNVLFPRAIELERSGPRAKASTP